MVPYVLEVEAHWTKKGRGCADGCKKRPYMQKEETIMPTVAAKSLFKSPTMDAYMRQDTVATNNPIAFTQSDTVGMSV